MIWNTERGLPADAVEIADAQPRPGFIALDLLPEVLDREEPGFVDGLLFRRDAGLFERIHVDDTEMDPADVV